MNMRQGAQATTTVLLTLLVAFGAYYATSPRFHPSPVAAQVSLSPSKPVGGGKPPLPSPSATTSPATERFSVIGFDMVNLTHAWLLASDCPLHEAPTCRYEVARSLDGGSTWSRPVFVGGNVSSELGGNRSIKFLNANDGFVYNESAAFVTHDGGVTWRNLSIPFVFIGAVGGRGNAAWLVTYPCKKAVPCPSELRSSIDGGHTWSGPRQLAPRFTPERIDAFANGAMLAELAAPFPIEVTTDGGSTWVDAGAPCPASTFEAAVASADGVEVWAACYPYQADSGPATAFKLWVSENSGRSWVSRKSVSAAGALFVSPRPHVLFASDTDMTTVMSDDAGLTWKAVQLADGSAHFAIIQFASADFGWAGDALGSSWTTNDGGSTWRRGPARPSTII